MENLNRNVLPHAVCCNISIAELLYYFVKLLQNSKLLWALLNIDIIFGTVWFRLLVIGIFCRGRQNLGSVHSNIKSLLRHSVDNMGTICTCLFLTFLFFIKQM